MFFFLSNFFQKGCYSPENLTFLTFLFCNGTLLLFFHFFHLKGLIAYSTVAIIASNIHVLKVAAFSFASEPIALGTVIFSSLYLCSDLATEFYGLKKARQMIHLNLMAFILMGILMLIALGYPPLPSERDQQVYQAIQTLFLPVPSLIAASLTSYLISQYNDVFIFALVRHFTGSRMLWLRTTLATLISGFIDTVIFSALAWVVFAVSPLPWHTVIWSYMLGTFWFRALIILCHTPIMYLAKYFFNRS